MAIGHITRWLFKFVFGLPKRIKRGVKETLDNTIDRTFEKHPGKIIIEEHHHIYYDIKNLNRTIT